MEAVVSCPHCGLRAKLPGAFRGGQLACPNCRKTFTPPMPDGESEFSVWVGDPAAVATTMGGVGMPDPEDAEAHLTWLREETQRFNEYVATTLATLEKRRHELTAIESQAEAMYLPREQELLRRTAAVAAREEALAAREAALAERSAELDRANEQLAPREAELKAREDLLAGTEARIEELQLQQAELLAAVESLEARRGEAEAVITAAAGQRAMIVRREAELDRAEQALARRLAEVEELEQQLREEIEEQEQELINRRRELEQQRLAVTPPALSSATPPPRSRLVLPY